MQTIHKSARKLYETAYHHITLNLITDYGKCPEPYQTDIRAV